MPGVIESYIYLGCILALAVLVAAKTSARRDDRGPAAVVLLWIALTLLAAIWLPGFNYLFTWPALAGAVALCWRSEGKIAIPTVRFALVAAPTLILMTPAVDFFFQMAQPRPGNPDSEMPAAVVLPLILALMSAGLLRAAWPRR